MIAEHKLKSLDPIFVFILAIIIITNITSNVLCDVLDNI